MSLGPPGGSGTTMRIVFSGQDWAVATWLIASAAQARIVLKLAVAGILGIESGIGVGLEIWWENKKTAVSSGPEND
jgi:hypothetical protein